jgi:DNA gyrase subunit A
LATSEGRAIRFNESTVRPMGRNASGVRGVTLTSASDVVIGMICVEDIFSTILVVSEKGYGKRTFLSDPEDNEPVYRITNRGGKGVKTLNVTDKTGPLTAIKTVTDEDDLMIITQSGMAIRMHVADIRVMGRTAQGVKLINLKGKESIAAVAKVPRSEDEEDEFDGEQLIDPSDENGTIVDDSSEE